MRLAWAIIWRILALLFFGAAQAVVKHIAIDGGADPYWTGRYIGMFSLIVTIALFWRWLPVRFVEDD